MQTINESEISNRLEELIKRRNIDFSTIRFRGRMRTSKWNVYEAAPKSKLMDYIDL